MSINIPFHGIDGAFPSLCRCLVYYIHIGVGFDVAYLYRDGKFEGQECEISNVYGSHAFLCKSSTQYQKT